MTNAIATVERKPLPKAFEEMHLDFPKDASQELRDQITLIMCILHGLTCNTFNPDVVALALYKAEDMGKAFGIPDETIKQMMVGYARYSKAIRSRNPMSKMYE